MSIIPLTVFFSLLLAGFFIAMFANEQRRRRFTSAEHDSLLPLAEEKFQTAPDDHDHDHDHAHGAAGCGCRDGSRPPCHGCLKRIAATPSSSLR